MPVENQHPSAQLDLPGLRRLLTRARRAAGLRGTVAVRLVDDATIRQLNRQFLHHDYPTDVLSFPLPLPGYAGDLAISLDTARRQARARRHTLDAEVGILLLHGLLHLAGYDHERDNGEMRRHERELRQKLGLPPGLLERERGGNIEARPRHG